MKPQSRAGTPAFRDSSDSVPLSKADATRLAMRLLADEEIEEVLRSGFSPHRCAVDFQDDGHKIALRVTALDGRQFLVECTRADSLRDPGTLLQYVRDVRYHLGQRKLHFSGR
jgi:hypothetical protein